MSGVTHEGQPGQRAGDPVAPSVWHLTWEGLCDGMWESDFRTGVTSYSRRWKELLGYAEDEIGAGEEEWSSRVHPEDLPGALAASQAHRVGVTSHYSHEHRLRCRDGSWKWILARGVVTERAPDGTPLRMVGTHTDISERKRAESALQESYALLTKVSRQVPGVIYQYRLFPDGRSCFPYASDGIHDIYEVTPEQVREDASPVFAILHPDDTPGIVSSIQESARTLGPWRHEYRVVLPVKGVRWCLGDARPERLPDGSVLWHGFITDITERRALEEQVRQSQKLDVIGRLAGGVAHDFNNILAAMTMNLELLRLDAARWPEAGARLDELEAMTRRAASLTQQLLMFGRRKVVRLAPLEINAALGSLLKMLARLIGEHIQVRHIAGAPELWVNADAGMLDQAVMNLCVNARDAMPDGGVLTLETARVEFTESALPPDEGARPGRFVRLSVTDTGCGMDESVQAHLFEPFFTTKELGKGTGLGLPTVHGIVHQHQGWISVESAPGRGTTFHLYLPLSERAAAVSPSRPLPPVATGRGETVLLVEDEPALRAMAGEMLARLGFRVVAAASGREALQAWEREGGAVDILLTDMMMPGGLNGMELAARLRERNPGLPVVVMSGYSSQILGGNMPQAAGYGYLAKPFDLRQLAGCLGERLRGTAG